MPSPECSVDQRVPLSLLPFSRNAVLLGLAYWTLSPWYAAPNPLGLLPANVLLIVCLCQSLFVRRCCSGVTLPRLSCHPGARRTLSFIRRRFWWPSLGKDVHRFVSSCPVCAQSKRATQPPSGLLQPLSIPKRPWSHIALDFVTGLPYPLPKLPSAKETANLMVTNVFKLHGLPVEVVSDRGPQFTSRFWQAFCKMLGASVCLSSGFHPQSNGQTERANQLLETVLRCLASQNPSSWSQQLPWAEYSINSLTSSSSGLSPFECCLGYQPPLFPAQEQEVGVPSAQAFVRRCHRMWRRARAALLRASARTKEQADGRRTMAPRYRVGLSTQDLPLKPHAPTPCIPTATPSHRWLSAYTVRRLLDARRRGRGWQYLVDWCYGPEERSWVPARQVLDPSLIRLAQSTVTPRGVP
ncbi:hypothetical protein ACEWY4_009190 [Coilia grayii]|uniref:Gypsy retrotransposon integrase-like protein 1 n=1 Tax=Coilia grayii TaxID=363190 RepID=A0ABD1K609_9TELE